MAIVGIITAAGFMAYNLHLKHQAIKTTKVNISLVTTALQGYLASNARYPCPSPLDAQRADPLYGLETDCTDTSIPVGTCSGGLCIEESERTVAGITPRVRRGAVPFRVLNLDETAAYDGYGNKLSYVVTERLADDATFDPDHGGISVVDANAPANSVIKPPASAHFIVFSHGTDQKGAYTRTGQVVTACTTSEADAENCNTSATNNLAIYASAPYNTANTNNHFDDHLAYNLSSERPMWKITDATGFDITDLTGSGGIVGLGVEPSAPSIAIEIDGNIHTPNNTLMSNICDDTGGDCFSPSLIGGAGMSCPTGQYMTGIANGMPICTPNIVAACPPGQFLIGVAPDYSPICSTPPASCPAQPETLCSTTQTLGASPNGAVITLNAGASYYEEYTCNSGTWNLTDSGGVCSCTPVNYTYTTGCPWGYSGSRQYQTVTVCPSGTTTNTLLSDTCTCVGASQLQTSSCPWPFTGGPRTRTRSYVCTTPTSGYVSYTPWDSSTCTCTPITQTDSPACPAGFTGAITRERTRQCPSGTWTSWTETSNTCVCTPTTQTDTDPCPPGETGLITKERTNNCPGGGWNPWVVVSDTCTPVSCAWTPVSSSSGQTSPPGTGSKVGSSCNCLSSPNKSCWEEAGFGQVKNYPSCACQVQ